MKEHPGRSQNGGKVLAFLDRHRLAHTPDHYSFAHEYLNGDDQDLRAKVYSVIDGGIRLTPAQVEKFRPSSTLQLLAPQIDHVTLRVLDVVSDALEIVSDLNRELVVASAALLDAPDGGAGPLIATVLERAENAEVRFADAARQARNIRAELTALQTTGQHDPLTGLINQAALDERLSADVRSQSTCVALVDIDGLRRINENHSPAVGDRLLKIVARDLIDQCPGHVVARSEGGTFAIVASDIDLAAAGRMVTRACEAFSARDMRVRESNKPLGHVTLSAGVVAVRGREAKAVLAAANEQLRCAKQGGRNQVAIESIVVGIAGGADVGGFSSSSGRVSSRASRPIRKRWSVAQLRVVYVWAYRHRR